MSRQTDSSGLAWMTVLLLGVVMCENALSDEPPTRPAASGQEETWDADRKLPKRIKAQAWSTGPLEPPRNLRDYYFSGSDLKRNPKGTRVSLEGASGYRSVYPRLDLYTLFPAVGGLYCFDGPASGRVSAFLVPRKDVRPGVRLGKDEDVYTFISFPNLPYRQTGDLDHHRVCIGPIEEEKHGEETRYTVKLVLHPKRTPPPSRQWPMKPDGTVDWKVMRVGDVLPVTEHRHYRLLNIVPPDDQGRMIRGHRCKMLGWIEFTRRPIRLPTKEEQTKE